jgi:arginine decarboxylase
MENIVREQYMWGLEQAEHELGRQSGKHLGQLPGQRDAREGVLPISIRTASGTGRTLLSAWDDALWLAGVANFNLIRLSSVIPRQSMLSFTTEPVAGEHGDQLFCVYASTLAENPGDTAWAGIGWTRDEDGRGLFVEHSATSEESLSELIHLSLEDMIERRGGGYGEIESVKVSARNEGQPACALAIATYQVSGWDLS